MTIEMAKSLDASDLKAMRVDLLMPATGTAALADDLTSDLQSLVAAATIDVSAADVKIAASFHRRHAVCAATRRPATVPIMRVVRFVVTPRIQTRWVDVWRDFRKDVAWPEM